MIKLVTFLKRSDRLTRPGFEERWSTVHAPIAARFPNLRGYMLSFSVERGEPAADGVAQLWFDSREAAQASYSSEIGRNGSSDASAWLSRRDHLLAGETWLRNTVPLSERPFKLMLGIKRAAMPRQDFVRWWHDTDADAAVQATGSDQIRLATDEAGQLLNSGTAGALALRDGEAAFDGLLEVWFDSADRMREGEARFAASPLRREIDARAASAETFLLRETVVVRPPAPAYGAEYEEETWLGKRPL